jgi:predicted GNAT family N-acyltransferase
LSDARPASSIVVKRVPIEAIIVLRDCVIIAGTARDTPYFEGDDDPATYHMAAYEGEQVVGCGSFMANDWQGEPAWQLRGMATDPALQGAGVGRALLQASEDLLRDESDRQTLWCNARVGVVGFYEKQAWRVVSDEFEVPGVGPHVRMVKPL